MAKIKIGVKKMSTKKILLGWMGFSDKNGFLASQKDASNTDYGPIGSTLMWDSFDKALILCNYQMYDICDDYIEWLKKLCRYRTEITIIKADVQDPTEYAPIYQAAIEAALRASKEKGTLTFQTSAGTAHMGVVWLMLQKRFNARLVKSSKDHGVSVITFPFNLSAELIEKGSTVEKATLLYESDIMSELIHRIDSVAPLSCPVLIEGESGTGKELIAQRLHSNRSQALSGDFIAVNCGAIPREIIESELFGHKKGTFTGAATDRKGKIELAHNGTLFLDEIGELPLDQQVKLLRVLQEKEISRLGDDSGKPIKVNFRLVAATNRNLIQEVSKGNFREDLYYRIAVICLKAPPLRKRGKSDIKLIAEYNLDKINAEFKQIQGYGQKRIADSGIEVLINYNWPGNIRELSTILYRAAVWNPESDEISADDINKAIGTQDSPHNSASNNTDNILNRLDREEAVDLESILNEVRRHYIKKALEKSHGHKTRASKMLGVRTRMDYYLGKLGIDAASYK